mgnify:CR=1 FL=1
MSNLELKLRDLAEFAQQQVPSRESYIQLAKKITLLNDHVEVRNEKMFHEIGLDILNDIENDPMLNHSLED